MDSRSYVYEEPETEVDLRELLWGLLDQWKAVLIVAFVAAALVPAVKLFRDNRSYQAAVKEAEATAQQAELPEGEGIEKVLETLSAEDRGAVELLVQQQELVKTQSGYLNNSILLSMDPANQRTLYVRYRLNAGDGVEVTPLADAYIALLRRNSSVQELGNIIDPEAGLSYIYELISALYSTVPDSSAKGIVLTVSIVLPNDIDANTIANKVDEFVRGIHDELSATMGAHTVDPLDRNEIRTYNNDIVSRKASLVASINSTRTAIKTNETALNASQKAAYTNAMQILNSSANNTGSAEEPSADEVEAATATTPNTATLPKKPSFSIKLAAVGFVVGSAVYAIAYVVVVIVRGRVGSAQMLQDYTASRLLGSVFYPRRYRGFDALFHSRMVNKMRFGKLGDVATQIDKTAVTVGSVCAHAGVDSIHVVSMGNEAGLANDVATAIASKGVETQVLTVTQDSGEELLLNVKNAVYVVDSNVKGSDAWAVSSLCRNYDVQQLGCVYVRGW